MESHRRTFTGLKIKFIKKLYFVFQPAWFGSAIYIGRSVYYFEYYNDAIYLLDLSENEELKKVENRWHVKTSGNQDFDVAAIIIAGGVGSFEPRKFPVKECEKFEGSSLFYSIKDKSIFKDKSVSIFGGGDSAL